MFISKFGTGHGKKIQKQSNNIYGIHENQQNISTIATKNMNEGTRKESLRSEVWRGGRLPDNKLATQDDYGF